MQIMDFEIVSHDSLLNPTDFITILQGSEFWIPLFLTV